MKFKQLLAGTVAMLASSAAMAGSLTGNVGVVSDYMFRGVDRSSSGPAVQGGVDYGFDFGAYTGVWVSNSSVGGGNEADVYGGYGMKLGPFNLDAGLIFYAFTEDTEAPAGKNADYAEIYVGGGIGPAALKVFYTNEFGFDAGGTDPEENELLYVTASATLTLNDTISFTPQIGFSSGDGAKDAFGDEYTDYSVTATKKLKDDMAVSLSVVASDLELAGPGTDTDDNPKFVVGFKKNFKI